MEIPWFKRYAEAIVTGLITTAIVGGAATLYAKYPTLLAPAAYCLVCGAAAFVVCVAVIGLRRIPKPSPCPNGDNIESYVRNWLDNQRITVTSDPSAPTYFRYRIRLKPDNEDLTIFRMRSESSEYVQVFSDMSLTDDNWKQLKKSFSEDEINHIMFDLKLELARAKVGYSGLLIPPTNFKIFRRVLIHPGLREPEFLSAIYDVEAAMHLVAVIYLRVIHEKNKQKKQPAPSELTSETATRELPPTSS